MTALPEGFQFSQSSLQDFVDCARRFQLRYVWRLAWPAVESEPVQENERTMQRGAAFHRMVQQQLLGVPVERLERLIHDDDLERWWSNYLRYGQPLWAATEKSGRYPETSLTATLGGQRLVAKYDLLLLGGTDENGGARLTIIDWKTSRQRPKRPWLAQRLQTRLYPYVLFSAGKRFAGYQPLEATHIEMIYWFAEFPEQPERFVYSAGQRAEDEAYLLRLLERVQKLPEGTGERSAAGDPGLLAEPTQDVRRCQFCVYRSLCERGVSAGSLDGADLAEIEAEADFDSTAGLDFEQIGEIAF